MAAAGRFRWGLISFLFFVPVTAQSQNQDAASDARAFIEQVYSRYSDPAKHDSLSAFDALFSPKLAALIKRDRKNAGPGYVGFLDFDPICQCQDDQGLSFRILAIKSDGLNAQVSVENRFAPPAAPSKERVTYQLVRIGKSWQIADISSKSMVSLREWLATQLGKQR